MFVGRLSHRAGERDVERFFKGYGRIREINMKNGFAFIVRPITCRNVFDYIRFKSFLNFSREFVRFYVFPFFDNTKKCIKGCLMYCNRSSSIAKDF